MMRKKEKKVKRGRWVLLGEAAISGRALCFCVTGRFELVSLGRVSGCYSFVVFNFYKRPPCGKIWMWSPCRWTLVSIFHVLTRI